ncbi:MAG TPA: ABC transporter substrate-binding protein [Burkholderiales bacterium]|nr:ABC transporter substrate-binding protein [Burkholderiales bacterium]
MGTATEFLAGMKELGYEVGRNLVVEARYAEGNPARWAAIADELLALKPDVVVVSSTGNALVMKDRTSTVPIVMGTVGDPVGDGIVQSLAKPGGNITGNSLQLVDLGGKQVELMAQALPQIRRAALLMDLSQPRSQTERYQRIATSAASKHGLALEVQGLDSADEIRRLLRNPSIRNSGALLVSPAPRFNVLRAELCRASVDLQLPLIGFSSEWPRDGALMSYSPSWPEAYRRAAYFVDRILKGAKPADLPVEQPTKFELVINRRTAKALGIVIPRAILLRADRVIE